MDLKNLTRLFKTGSKKEKTSVYLSVPILDALKTLSEQTGNSVSDIIAEILDEAFTQLVEQGRLERPKAAVTEEASSTAAQES